MPNMLAALRYYLLLEELVLSGDLDLDDDFNNEDEGEDERAQGSGLGRISPLSRQTGGVPCVEQEGQYNGRKMQHTLNYQGIVATDGILIHLSKA
ncbi:hypothetical protein BGX29_005476, partial [Mortierella sp. GBA35]